MAISGLVAYITLLPVTRVYNLAVSPGQASRTIVALAALGLIVPVQAWLTVSAARATWGWQQGCTLAVLVGFLLALLPTEGVAWVGTLNVSAGLTLVAIRRPWSLLLFALYVAAAAPLTFMVGHPQWAIYFTLSIPFTALPIATGVWLIRAVRQLQLARVELADQAVVRERLRVDDELRTSVGSSLTEIATRADAAKAILETDSPAATRQLGIVVDAARRTLTEARGLVGRYREPSLRSELETIASLLTAAGIDTQLELPPGQLAGFLNENARTTLHRVVGDLIGGRAGAATISVTKSEGVIRVALRAGTDTWTTEVVAA